MQKLFPVHGRESKQYARVLKQSRGKVPACREAVFFKPSIALQKPRCSPAKPHYG